jgi:hypothetical protein
MLGFGLLLLGVVGANIGVHVEQVGELSPELKRALIEDLGRAIDKRSGKKAVLDEVSTACLEPDGCLAAVSSRTASDEVLLLKLFNGPLSIHVLAERAQGASRQRSEADLPKTRSAWQVPLQDLVVRLLPSQVLPTVAAATPLDIGLGLRPPSRRTITPWLILGGAALAVGGAALLGSDSSSAADQLSTRQGPAAFPGLVSRARTEATLSEILYAVGAAAGVTGLALLIWQ